MILRILIRSHILALLPWLLLGCGGAVVDSPAPEEVAVAPSPTPLSVALSQVGVMEVGNNAGAEVEAYLGSVGLGKGAPWCAAFVHWCYRECGIVIEPRRKYAMALEWHREERRVWEKGTWKRDSHERISKDADHFSLYYDNLGRIGHTGLIRGEDEDYILTVEGNGLPLKAMILTPTGWTTMDSISIGDEVIDPHGDYSVVVGKFPQGCRPVYRIEFQDGTTLVADESHRWLMGIGATRKLAIYDVVTTYEMIRLMEDGRRLYLPFINPVELRSAAPLSIDPYILGLLIGDGYLGKSNPKFTTSDCDLLASMTAYAESIGGMVCHDGRLDYRVLSPDISNSLREYGLMGKLSHSKFIPSAFKWTSSANRLALLQGLMDTDGSIDASGRAEYCTVSKELASDVQFLIESLGGKGRICLKTGIKYTSPTQKTPKSARDAYVIRNIRFPENLRINPFRLPRKSSRVRHEKFNLRGWGVKSITPIGQEETVCISVSAPSQLYVTDHFIPTHNTGSGGEREGSGVYLRRRLKRTIHCISRWDIPSPHGTAHLHPQRGLPGL